MMDCISRHPKKGFAIVIMLSLMTFILLLLLSLSTLLRVESQSVEQSQQLLQARANALLALQMAIGSVQKELGPDQRVSAGAEFINSAHSENVYWTGVWDSDPSSSTYGERLAWLISEDALNENPLSVGNEIDEEEQVRLIRVSRIANGENADYLRLPLQGLSSGSRAAPAGAYAWWVGDEGIKARVNLRYSAEFPSDSHIAKQIDELSVLDSELFDTLTMRRPGLARLDGVKMSAVSPKVLNNLSMAGVESQVKLVLSGIMDAESSVFEHEDPFISMNFSLHSEGLLCDVKNGGLRKNLTAAFYDDNEFAKLLGDVGVGWDGGSVFDQLNPGSTPEEDPGGPKWAQMRSYFNQSGVLQSDGSIEMVMPDTVGALASLDEVSAVTPVLALAQMELRGGIHNDGSGNYEVVVFAQPSIALWNPYNADLDTGQDLYVEFAMVDTEEDSDESGIYSRYGDWRVIGYTVNNKTTGDKKMDNWLNRTVFGSRWLRFAIPRTTIPAGESVLFAASENREMAFVSGSRADAVQNRLSDEYSDGYGFYVRTGETFTLKPSENESHLRVRLKSRETSAHRRRTSRYQWNIATDPNFEEGFVQVVPTHCKYAALGWGGADDIANGGWGNDPIFTDFSTDQPIPLWANGDFAELAFKYYRKFSDAGYDAAVHGPRRIQWIAQNNPRATYYGSGYYKGRGLIPPHAENFAFMGILESGSPELAIQLNSGGKGTPVGFSMGANGNDRAILYEVAHPDVPFVSIVQLGMTNFSRILGMGGFPVGDSWDYLFDSPQAAFPLGNSIYDPRLPLDQVAMTWEENPMTTFEGRDPLGTHYDYSYLMNEALWDRFFLTSESGLRDVLPEGDEALIFPLSNPRLLPSDGGEFIYEELRDYDMTAAKLKVEGAFNVNSAKVDAWKSLLSSFYGLPLQYRNLEEGGILQSSANSDASSFARHAVPSAANSAVTDNSSDDLVYTGFRALSEDEIDRLATEIVVKIKDRRQDGIPFLSLAEFVNRAPESDVQEHQTKGLMQAAIDESGLNQHLRQEYDLFKPEEFDVPNGTSGNKWNYGDGLLELEESVLKGAPGYLMQSEILSKLAPSLNVRSDTFRVRAYGCVMETYGEIGAKVWCEAIIQRQPDFIDSADKPEADLDSLGSATNRNFGRRFVIKQFRWLSEEEI